MPNQNLGELFTQAMDKIEHAVSDINIHTKTIEEVTIEIENVDMSIVASPQEKDIDTTLLREGPATVEIGEYTWEVVLEYNPQMGYMDFNQESGFGIALVDTPNTAIVIMDQTHTYNEPQTVRIIYPATTQLYSTENNLYLGADENGANGKKVITADDDNIAIGTNVIASGINSQAFGSGTIAYGDFAHAEGEETEAPGGGSHAEGYSTTASGNYSHAEGYGTTASGNRSHAEGYDTTASGNRSHAEGGSTVASGDKSHAEGDSTVASGNYSHAEGSNTSAYGSSSHTEGTNVTASGSSSHAEGTGNKISTKTFNNTTYTSTGARGDSSHAEGYETWAIGVESHAEGYKTEALNTCSHTEGYYTIAASQYQHAGGKYNLEDNANTYAEIIGNGTNGNARSNARALDWSGNEYLKGDLYIGCNADSTGGTKVTPLPAPPVSDGTYTLQCTVSSGVATYSWVSLPVASGVSF